MRHVNITIPVYKYEELSNAAKDVVKDDYLGFNRTTAEFDINVTNKLRDLGFCNIDVKFSLSHCQGDGLSFTGEICCEDLFKIDYIKDKLSLSDDVIANLKDTLDSVEIVRIDYRYTHYNTCKVVLNGNLNWMTNKDYCYLYDDITQYYQSLCRRFERDGYRWFYEVNEEEIIKYCTYNNLEFTSDGRIFDRTLETA